MDAGWTPFDVVIGARHVIAGGIVVFGFLFVFAGAAGVLRFPDFHTRLQALGPMTSLGAASILIGLGVEAWDARMSLRLALLGALLVITAPAAAQMLANAAHAAGLAPLVGKLRPHDKPDGARPS